MSTCTVPSWYLREEDPYVVANCKIRRALSSRAPIIQKIFFWSQFCGHYLRATVFGAGIVVKVKFWANDLMTIFRIYSNYKLLINIQIRFDIIIMMKSTRKIFPLFKWIHPFIENPFVSHQYLQQKMTSDFQQCL